MGWVLTKMFGNSLKSFWDLSFKKRCTFVKFVVCFLGGLVGRKQKIGGMLKGELSVLRVNGLAVFF